MTLPESSYSQSDTLLSFLPAFLAAQTEMEALEKNQTNEYFNNSYADLAQVLKVAKPALNKHGIMIMFFPCNGTGTIGVHTRLIHTSGEWISNTISGPLPKQDPQGVGIALTYFRRYGLSALISLAQEDKDGNMPREQQQPQQGNQRPQQPQRPPYQPKNKQQNQPAKPQQNTQNPAYSKNAGTPPKDENFIIPICAEIKKIKDGTEFVAYVVQELPNKSIPKDQRTILWDFCIKHGDELGLVYMPETKEWISIAPSDGILKREIQATQTVTQ